MKRIFSTANILIPADELLPKWSVIACDQFSSEREYWERIKNDIADNPSSLNLIVPETYLEEIDEDVEIKKINTTMQSYIDKGIFVDIADSFIYIERTQPDGRVRKGIIGAVDLDEYDYTGKSSAIRASEGTVLDRLPARVKIRKAAPLELPHIITFIDDKKDIVIGQIAKKVDNLPLLYDFPLMEGGGFIKGWQVTGKDAENVINALDLLYKDGLLMIMGDGNHSLAAAKVYWEEIKQGLSEKERENHPARKALVELNNVYDPAVDFEAIHRVIFDVDADAFVNGFIEAMPKGNDYKIKWITKNGESDINIKAECIGDLYELMQDFVDEYVKANGGIIDYIHGEEATEKLAKRKHTVGLILPSMCKSDFFETVAKRGVFPRKSFSVGHAKDKRYYLECRKLY
ncbi:MAG: DUF1015 domain-containing protein [Oscillospiraceae bacterium]|jgi:uncharacterized protein (DUF1015 family)|nr:DUF1015 domain-containing protein [Oscillospiraceae bacterium]